LGEGEVLQKLAGIWVISGRHNADRTPPATLGDAYHVFFTFRPTCSKLPWEQKGTTGLEAFHRSDLPLNFANKSSPHPRPPMSGLFTFSSWRGATADHQPDQVR
jgi:hypothetical protein